MKMRIDNDRFFRYYRHEFNPRRISQKQVDGLREIVAFLAKHLVGTASSIPWAAYMLATVKHETANTFQPIVERGRRAYFDRYEITSKNPRHRRIARSLGNTEPGDGWLTRGRGYIMITGRDNYVQFSPIVGIDLIKQPDAARIPSVALKIMHHGMVQGLFTGKRLGHFITPQKINYPQARRIVNRMDKAMVIAAYAEKFEIVLYASRQEPLR